jgi:hypothetical protein
VCDLDASEPCGKRSSAPKPTPADGFGIAGVTIDKREQIVYTSPFHSMERVVLLAGIRRVLVQPRGKIFL